MDNKLLILIIRLGLGLYIFLTSLYCLLAYVPFTHNWVINCTLVSWLPIFVKLHPLLYWLTFVLSTITLITDYRSRTTRPFTFWLFILQVVAGVALIFHPLLMNLPFDERSFIWSLLVLLPLLWIGVIDYIKCINLVQWERPKENLALSTAVMAALFSSLVYVLIFYLRYGLNEGLNFKSSELAIAVGWSLISHLLIFIALFVCLTVIRVFSARTSKPARTEFLFCNALAFLLGIWIFEKFVLSPLSFSHSSAYIYSIMVSLSVVIFLSGLSLRLCYIEKREIQSGIGLSLRLFTLSQNSSWSRRVIWVISIVTLAYLIPVGIAQSDWDFMMQKLSIVLIWTAVFAFFYSIQVWVRKDQYRAVFLLLLFSVSLASYKILDISRTRSPEVDLMLVKYAGYDISLKVIRQLIFPDRRDPGLMDEKEFYDYLRSNSDIPGTKKVDPVEVNLVDDLALKPGTRPHIFMFVVDSLRQDYLSPYNKKVHFTPEIENFAHESVVMKNAFTPYAGTALAEPAIWAGGLLLHKQYVTPFYPMNSLQKLIDAEDYEQFISIDPHLEQILQITPRIKPLDLRTNWVYYDLCTSLKELQQKIDARPDPTRPIFSYIQPQNVHMVAMFLALKEKKISEPSNDEFPGFNATIASQLQRIDRCFGDFIRYLKSKGLYDNSVVVLTSDHGDSLGEEGRWGHTSVFPEVIRIPLIVHLPLKEKENLVWDTDSVAFSSDITPSLYYLLGHKSIKKKDLFGKPLFTETRREQDEYKREAYFVGHSYGPVYGILRDNGRSLFIASAIENIEYFYDLSEERLGRRRPLTSAIRDQNERLILQYIASINQLYNYRN